MATLHYGMNRRELDRIFISLGGEIVRPRRTGEVRYRHPLLHEQPRADGRRKDAPNHLVRFVLEVERRSGHPGHAA